MAYMNICTPFMLGGFILREKPWLVQACYSKPFQRMPSEWTCSFVSQSNYRTVFTLRMQRCQCFAHTKMHPLYWQKR